MNNINLASNLILNACQENINTSESIAEWCVSKVRHTFEVAAVALNIINSNETLKSLSAEQKETIHLAAILHDLGRFYQHENGKRIRNADYDHGKKAVEILQSLSPRDGGVKAFADPVILFAIDEHDSNEINLSAAPSDFAITAAKIVRDADKLANIYSMTLTPNKIFQNDGKGFSPAIRQAVKTGAPILYKDMSAPADETMSVLEWLKDINFPFTNQEIQRIGFLDKGLQRLAEQGAAADEIELIRKRYK